MEIIKNAWVELSAFFAKGKGLAKLFNSLEISEADDVNLNILSFKK